MKISKKELRLIINEALGDRGDLPKKKQYRIGMRGPEDLPYGNVTGKVTTPEQLQQHVFPDSHKTDTKPADYYHIETIVMTVGLQNPMGFTVNDVFDYIYKNKLEPYTEMSFDDLHQVCIDLARDGVLEGYEDFFMMVDLG